MAWSLDDERELQRLIDKRKSAHDLQLEAGVSSGQMSEAFKRGAPDENESWEEIDGLDPPMPGLGANDLLPKVIDHEVQVKHLIPPGVASFKQWGRTIVAFGKFDKMGISYAELVADGSKAQYVQWARGHLTKDTTAGPSSDFGAYIRAHDIVQMSKLREGPTYAGTSVRREYKR